MKFLLDTNILIPAEPTSPLFVESATPIVTALLGLIGEAGFQALVHPASVEELAGDKDSDRRQLRSHLLSKYVRLPSPPPITQAMRDTIGSPPFGSHDEIDNRLLACVVGDAVDYLVTADEKIHRKAKRLGISNRVERPSNAALIVRGFTAIRTPSSPIVEMTKCHNLDINDAIFTSIRSDYEGFDDWLTKAKRSHRDVFLIRSPSGLAGLAIIKEEDPAEKSFVGKTLKICTFKVAEHSRGLRYGELLLRALFDHMEDQRYEVAYLTCFPKQRPLLELLQSLGFFVHGRTAGEIIMAKRIRPFPEEYGGLNPYEFHFRFGPHRIKAKDCNAYVIPIKPHYHAALFPEMETQRSLFQGQTPFGNSILKAYLCHSPTKEIPPGSILLFYRSTDLRSIRCIGIADGSLRSKSKLELMRYVGQRTVYTETDIDLMCQGGQKTTLAILFRQAKTIDPVTIAALMSSGGLNGTPQSITQIPLGRLEWLQRSIEA